MTAPTTPTTPAPFVLVEVIGFNDATDELHIHVPMSGPEGDMPTTEGSLNEDLDCDDFHMPYYLFQMLVGTDRDPANMIGIVFRMPAVGRV